MSDTTGVEGVAESAAAQQVTDQATENQPQQVDPAEVVRGNPAWGEILDKTPKALHPMMTPVFEKWDKNFQEVQTKYAPYKDFVDQGITPDQIGQSLQVLQLLNNNPRAVYDQMVQTFGEEWGLTPAQAEAAAQQVVQGQQETPANFDLSQGQDSNVIDIEKDPRFVQMKQQVDTVAQYLAGEIQAKQQQEVEAALDQEVAELEGRHGQFNKQIVFALAANGTPLEQAVLAWKQDVQQRQPAPGSNFPPVMTPGGGSPSQAVDVTALNNKDTIGLVKSWIANANKE